VPFLDGIPGYEANIFEAGKEPLFVLLVSFLITFALTRLYTRLARIRGWGSASAGGVHMHHLVVGIGLLIASGLLVFALEPARVATGILAILFGGGAALTLDEFALWFHLRDVYWSDEGRSSIDATILVVLLAGLILTGASPVDSRSDYESGVGYSIGIGFHFLWVIVTLLRGKLLLGAVAVLIPLVGLIGGIRLAKPSSPWAKWFYRSSEGKPWYTRWMFRKGEAKLATASERFEQGWAVRFGRRFEDVVGGAPSLPSPTSGYRSASQDPEGSEGPGPRTPTAANSRDQIDR
jgi:hypothetical protein